MKAPATLGAIAGVNNDEPSRGTSLSGVRVLDLTTFLSGPFCTQILADLGADVVKLEAPDGDASRSIPPYFVGGDSAYYLATNRNKRSVAVDLKSPAGLPIAHALIARSDIVVENFRRGVCERLGLDPRKLRADDPRLIWASISGFGQNGQWRGRPAYDLIVQAASGVMSLTGEPGRPAVRVGIPIGDLVAGLYAAAGIVAALFNREITGVGREVDVSMFDGQLAMLSYQAAYSLIGGVTPAPQGSRHDSIPTYRTFTAKDGRELAVTANTERMWLDLCTVLGKPDLTQDSRYASASARLENRRELWVALEDAFRLETADVWVERLNAYGVPAAAINTVPEALALADAISPSMVLKLTSAEGNVARVVGNPIRTIDAHGEPHGFPPRLGEHTDDVLRELGVPGEDVHKLRAQRVVA